MKKTIISISQLSIIISQKKCSCSTTGKPIIAEQEHNKKSKNHYTIQSQNGIAKILYNYERRKNYEFQKNCNYHYGCFISNFK